MNESRQFHLREHKGSINTTDIIPPFSKLSEFAYYFLMHFHTANLQDLVSLVLAGITPLLGVVFYLIGQEGIDIIGVPPKEMDIVSYFLYD